MFPSAKVVLFFETCTCGGAKTHLTRFCTGGCREEKMLNSLITPTFFQKEGGRYAFSRTFAAKKD